MFRILIFAFMISFLIPSNVIYSSAIEQGLYDSDEEIARNLSRQYNVEIEKVRFTMLVASAERAANTCGFSFAPNFYDSKNLILTSKKFTKIYNQLLRMPMTIPQNMKDSWCSMIYRQYHSGHSRDWFN